MGIIINQVKQAVDNYRQDGDLQKFAMKIAYDTDNSVRYAWMMACVRDAIREHCPKPMFECIYYDGEHGEYRLFDFDPNVLSKRALIAEIRSRLEHECHVDPDGVDKAMESVYLIDTNAMIRVVT